MAGRSRRGTSRIAEECSCRVRRRGAGALVDDERNAVRSAAPSQAGGADVGNDTTLVAALGSARLSQACLAGASALACAVVAPHTAAPPTSRQSQQRGRDMPTNSKHPETEGRDQ